jgi:hypothetical protein
MHRQAFFHTSSNPVAQIALPDGETPPKVPPENRASRLAIL